MRFYHQAVHVEVERLLRDVGDQLRVPANMAGIADQWKFGAKQPQLNSHFPARDVPERRKLIGVETTMHRHQFIYSRAIEALQGAQPQLQLRVHRVFYQYRNVCSAQGIRDLLYRKRIYRGSRTYPQNIDPVSQTFFHVRGIRHFGSTGQTGLAFYLLHPFQRALAHAFKSTGAGAGLPNARAENYFFINGSDAARGSQHLLFRLSAAGTADDERALCSLQPGTNRCYFQIRFHDHCAFTYSPNTLSWLVLRFIFFSAREKSA